jgi:hypothetical protein
MWNDAFADYQKPIPNKNIGLTCQLNDYIFIRDCVDTPNNLSVLQMINNLNIPNKSLKQLFPTRKIFFEKKIWLKNF